MKALVCTRLGGPDDLEIHDLADPIAGPGEVVVRVEAAALNFFDTLIIAGRYQTKPQLPFSPAAEFAGTVEAVGEGVTAIKPGERVAGYAGYGAARERIAVAADRVVKLPPGLEAERAAGLIVTYGTSYYALKDRAALKAGETLAVLGAAGGRRAGGGRARRHHGGARHRLCVLGRQARLRAPARRRARR